MNRRTSGILLHLSSLPGNYGIGDLGPAARRFADFLARAGQNIWQMLPLNPTAVEHGSSPYHSCSAFAGNPLFISPQDLLADGWLNKSEIVPPASMGARKVPYAAAAAFKKRLLERAYRRFSAKTGNDDGFERFCGATPWLDDYALFKALQSHFKTGFWPRWPAPIRERRPAAMETARHKLFPAIERHKFQQFLFFRQWRAFKAYCRGLDVSLVGDMPIYVPLESADVWSHADVFKLNRRGLPQALSGVPPDYFSRKGQLWGHPVYHWERLKKTRYQWWIDRMAHAFDLFDIVRIDHFRGLVAYWEVPAGARTAVNGKWMPVPASDFFHRLLKHFGRLPVIAEDLGTITADVREAIRQLGFPGMRVLQFAFGDDFPCSSFLPHNHERRGVVYTGTHDNNTTRGWFEQEADPLVHKHLKAYLGRAVSPADAAWEMIRLAMMSVAETVIIPCQDLLGLGAEARMNHPARSRGNWGWRLSPGVLTAQLAQRLHDVTATFDRC